VREGKNTGSTIEIVRGADIDTGEKMFANTIKKLVAKHARKHIQFKVLFDIHNFWIGFDWHICPGHIWLYCWVVPMVKLQLHIRHTK